SHCGRAGSIQAVLRSSGRSSGLAFGVLGWAMLAPTRKPDPNPKPVGQVRQPVRFCDPAGKPPDFFGAPSGILFPPAPLAARPPAFLPLAGSRQSSATTPPPSLHSVPLV